MFKRKKNALTTLKAYETFPLAYADKRDPKTNSTIPSDENVKAAKDWVDFNQK